MHIPVIITIMLLSILAIVFNGCLIILVTKRHKQNISFRLIKGISLVDTLHGISNLFMYSFRFYLEDYAYESSWYCSLFGFNFVFLIIQSGILVSSLAIERYILVCHYSEIPKLWCWIIFILSCLVTIPLIINSINNDFIPDQSKVFCFPSGSIWSELSKYLLRVFLIVPLIIVIFCYLSITLKCRNQGELMSKSNLTIRSIIFLIAYSACYLHIFVFYLFKFAHVNVDPRILYGAIPISVTASAAINPILILFLHQPLFKIFRLSFRNQTTTNSHHLQMNLHSYPNFEEPEQL